jgi:energy-coupling factor transporter ATP-binding protein EcfA2
MQQRAAIARSLIHDPKLVLMDEPFGALDALTREKMNLELLRIWKQSGKTILFVTHGISEAVFLGSRVVVFTAGPARMADNFTIELPYPRTLDIKTHEAFGAYTRRIYSCSAWSERMPAPARRPAATRREPSARWSRGRARRRCRRPCSRATPGSADRCGCAAAACRPKARTGRGAPRDRRGPRLRAGRRSRR